MFDLLISLWNGFYGIFAFIFSLITNTLTLLSLIPQYIELASLSIAFLPSPVISVAILTVSIYALYLFLGR